MVEDPENDLTGEPNPEQDVTIKYDSGGFVDDAQAATLREPPPGMRGSTPPPMRTPPPPPPPPPPGRTPVPPTRSGISQSGAPRTPVSHLDAATEAMHRAEAPSAGRKLGDFALEKKIGQGGMGEVWRARQISLDRPVAVKVLPRTLATMPGFIDRFQREAKAAANIIHPHVIQIYAYGIEEGTPYFAMEFVEGEDLQQRLRRVKRLALEEVVDTTIAVASALGVAHEKGVIHRDVKPSNVMIDRQGNVKVMDFGLAKAASTGTELTQSGIILGTPNYISPEQGRGDPLDGRADLYSLGVMFYELLTGSLPFTSDSPAGLIFKHVYEPPDPPRKRNGSVPQFLEEVALKLLAKDPADRYPDAKALLVDLRDFMDNEDYYLAGGARRTTTERRRSGTGSSQTVAVERDEEPGEIDEKAASFDQDGQTRQLDREEVEAAEQPIGNAVTEEMARQTGMTRKPPERSSAAVPIGIVVVAALGVAGFFGYQQMQKNQGDGGTSGVDSGAPLSLVFSEAEIGFHGRANATIQPVGKASSILTLKAGEPRQLPRGDYQLTVERRGYKKIDKLVTLRDDGNKNALVYLTETGGKFRLADAYEPTDELREVYQKGDDAAKDGHLDVALGAFEVAKNIDPDYRPATNPRTSQQRYDETKKAIDEAKKNLDTDAQAFKDAEDLKTKKLWRDLQKKAEPRKADPKWSGLLDIASTQIKQADALTHDVEAALARGDFAEAQAKLKDLQAVDPDNPRRDELGGAISSNEQERTKAVSGAQTAIKGAEVGPLEQAKAALDAYIAHAPKDESAKTLLEQVEGRLSEARNLSAEGPLVEAMKKEDWDGAARIVAQIEKANPKHSKLKEWKDKVDDGLHVQGVRKAVDGLDAKLLRAADAPDEVLQLLDPQSPGFAEEQKAFRGLREAATKIVKSRHRDLKVDLKPSADRRAFSADVRSVWDLELEVEGEPVKISREHVLSLAGDKDWKFTRFTLKEE